MSEYLNLARTLVRQNNLFYSLVILYSVWCKYQCMFYWGGKGGLGWMMFPAEFLDLIKLSPFHCYASNIHAFCLMPTIAVFQLYPNITYMQIVNMITYTCL
jgi:hypothetical protein